MIMNQLLLFGMKENYIRIWRIRIYVVWYGPAQQLLQCIFIEGLYLKGLLFRSFYYLQRHL